MPTASTRVRPTVAGTAIVTWIVGPLAHRIGGARHGDHRSRAPTFLIFGPHEATDIIGRPETDLGLRGLLHLMRFDRRQTSGTRNRCSRAEREPIRGGSLLRRRAGRSRDDLKAGTLQHRDNPATGDFGEGQGRLGLPRHRHKARAKRQGQTIERDLDRFARQAMGHADRTVLRRLDQRV
jgi:hypothetical protein